MKTRSTRSSIIICIAVVFSVAVLRIPALCAPINYNVQFTAGAFDIDPIGLTGSQFELNYTWDVSPLTPDFDAPYSGNDRVTVWPTTNSSYSLTIAGSAGSDGTYTGTTSGDSKWQLTDNNPLSNDVVQFPSVFFILSGQLIDIGGLNAFFPASFNNPSPPGTVFPYEFQDSDVASWQSPGIMYVDPGFGMGTGENVVGSAALVPEPISSTLFIVGGATLGFRRLRKKVKNI